MKPATAEAGVQAGLKEWIGLAVLALPALLVSIDVSVMILALPHIGVDLGADSAEQLWIMDIYGFMLSGFLIPMGTLGDRIGRRRLLMIGAAAFGSASVLAAFSISAGMLIAARALLGIAGAIVSPSSMALVGNMFRDPKQRSLAFGIWFTCSMGGMALGPVVGGAMLEHYGWGSVFLLGVPFMLLLLLAAPALLPEFRHPAPGRLDIASVILSMGAVFPAIYGLKEAAKHGLQTVQILAVAAGIAFGIAFVRRQRRLASPLIDLGMFFRSSVGTALGSLFGITLTGVIMLYVAQYLQFVQGMSPLRAALWMLPGVLASMAGMLLSPLVARRIRPAYLIGAGLVVSAAGCILLAVVEIQSGYAVLIAGYILFQGGSSPLPSLSSDLVVGSAPPERAGSAASMLQTSGEFAYALGIAVLGSIGTYIYRNQMTGILSPDVPPAAASASQGSLTGAVAAAGDLADPARAALLGGAREAYIAGMHAVAAICGAIVMVIAVLAITKLRHIRPIGQAGSEGSRNG